MSSARVPRSTFLFLVLISFLYYWMPFGFSLSLPKAIGILLALVVVIHVGQDAIWRRPTFPRRLISILWPIAMFQALEFISNLQSRMVPPSELISRDIGALIWLVLPIVFIRSDRDVEWTMRCYCLAVAAAHIGILLNGFGIVSFDFGTQGEERVFGNQTSIYASRSAGFLINFGDVAIYTSFAIPWLVKSLANRYKANIRLFSALCIALLICGSIVSLSRNVWLSSIVALLALAGVRFSRMNGSNIALAVAFALPLIAFVSVQALFGQMQLLYDLAVNVREVSVQDRILQYQAALSALGDNPLLGPGPGFTYTGVEVHSIYLNAFVHAGVGGFFLCGLLFYVLLKLFRRARSVGLDNAASIAGYCGVLTSIAFYPVILNSAPIFWMTLGIVTAIAMLPRQRRPLVVSDHVGVLVAKDSSRLN